MICKPTSPLRRAAKRAFTLAEVLAAMLFMALVIPVALRALHVASGAGLVGQRKLVAARIGNKILNELKVTGQLQNTTQSGTVNENGVDYGWNVRNEMWTEDLTTTMTVATLTVNYMVQGRDYDVKLSTLMPQATR